MIWDAWKKGFYAWENATADYAEEVLKNPAVLKPAGTMLSVAMRVKAANRKAVATWMSAMGVATRKDQERTLHALNQLQSQLYDLEDRIEELSK